MTLTLTLDRVEVTLVRICGRGLTTHQIRWKSEKVFVDVRTDVQTDVRTHLSSNLLRHRRGDDLTRFSHLLRHPASKWRGLILVSVLHKTVTYLLT